MQKINQLQKARKQPKPLFNHKKARYVSGLFIMRIADTLERLINVIGIRTQNTFINRVQVYD